jgi:hypothetical protein
MGVLKYEGLVFTDRASQSSIKAAISNLGNLGGDIRLYDGKGCLGLLIDSLNF